MPILQITRLVWREWNSSDAVILTYMAKSILAGLLALWISMKFNLPDPRTAIFTVFIVMHPQSGLVFTKSYYRIVGTLAGALFSLLLVSIFAQDISWLMAVFALWIGVCTAGGFKYRNFQSYGFILAGYTVCIIILPVIETPTEIFNSTISRFCEVLVGILCATVVSDTIFPRRLSNSMANSEKERFYGILSALKNKDTLFECKSESQMPNFLSASVGLHTIRINSSFESVNDKKMRLYHQQLNHEFMNLSTTFHSLKNIIGANKNHLDDELLASLANVYAPISAALQIQNPTNYITDIAKRLFSAKSEISSVVITEQRRLESLRQAYNINDFSSAANLIVRLSAELYVYSMTFSSFINYKPSDNERELGSVVSFPTHADNILVALAAFRGVLALAISVLFWKLTAWPMAIQTITMAVISGMLFSTLPNPIGAMNAFLKGSIIAFIPAAVLDFYIIPQTTDFIGISLVVSPILALIGWWMTQPKWIGFAQGFIFMFMWQTALDSFYKIEPVSFVENGIASLLGLMISMAAYLLVNFWSGSLTRHRVAKKLSRQIMKLCTQTPIPKRTSIEIIGRDLVQQFSTQGRLDAASSRTVFGWLLSTLEIGRAIIHIRQDLLLLHPMHRPIQIQLAVEELSDFFETSIESRLQRVIEKLEVFIQIILRPKQPLSVIEQKAIQHIADELNLIKIIMISKASLPMITED